MDSREAFYETYVDKIYTFCYYRTKMHEVAEDITSETFLRFYSKNGINMSNPVAYLYTICRNLIVDHYRLQSKTVSLGQFSPDSAIFSGIEDHEQKLMISQMLEAMKKLPEDQKEVLEMKYVQDLDNQTIAETIGKSESAIKSLAYRGLETLRKKFSTN